MSTGKVNALTVAINALPQHLRDYIHDLESRADPAGDLRARRVAEDAAAAYKAEIDRLMMIAFQRESQEKDRAIEQVIQWANEIREPRWVASPPSQDQDDHRSGRDGAARVRGGP